MTATRSFISGARGLCCIFQGLFVCLLFLTPLPCDFLKEKKNPFITTHGICKLIPFKLKMSIFFFQNNLCNCRVGKKALTAVICLAKNKLLEPRLVNSGVRVFLAEV